MAGSYEHGSEPFGSTKGIGISSIDEHLWFVENTFALPHLLAGCCQMWGESWFHRPLFPSRICK